VRECFKGDEASQWKRPKLEADQISFSFYFSAFYVSAEKDISIFVSFLFSVFYGHDGGGCCSV